MTTQKRITAKTSSNVRDLIRTGPSAITIAALGLSLACALPAQQTGRQPATLDAAESHNGPAVTLYNNMSYASLPSDISYILPASTNAHCYVVGVSIAKGKKTLFARVEGPYMGNDTNRYTCGYYTYADHPITAAAKSPVTSKGAEIFKGKETTIKREDIVTASIIIANGKVNLSIVNGTNGDRVDLTEPDSATSLNMRPFYKPPSHGHAADSNTQTICYGEPVRVIVTSKVKRWRFSQ
jgi:hypothetical protein